MSYSLKKIFIYLLVFSLVACSNDKEEINIDYSTLTVDFSYEDIDEYSNEEVIIINNNEPYFDDINIDEVFEYYGELDDLNRCTFAIANISKDLMPDGEREDISDIKPTGWHSVFYDDFIYDSGLYNRSHLIAYMLTGENANERNLITGTRFMNSVLMLEYEEMIYDYINETNDTVLYRVTPIFIDDDLVARGLLLEAKSHINNGLEFCVFVYNIQPCIVIDYSDGDSEVCEECNLYLEADEEYILNTNSMKFHSLDCSGVEDISGHNKEYFKGSRELLLMQGYEPCGSCNP